jgi:hypothetical protein
LKEEDDAARDAGGGVGGVEEGAQAVSIAAAPRCGPWRRDPIPTPRAPR